MIDDDAEYESRRQIRAQADADVAAFISSLDQDEGSGVPPPVSIRISEVSTKPVKFSPFVLGREESETAPVPVHPPITTGACCISGDCSILSESDCSIAGGTYQGDNTDCDPNPCPSPCSFCNLPGHVQGEISFSGVFSCEDDTECTVTGSASLDNDFTEIIGGAELGFFGGIGSLTIECVGASPCNVSADPGFTLELYVQCDGGNYTIHIFLEFAACCAGTISFALNGGVFTPYTPPVTDGVFPLTSDPEGGSGSATLTLTSGACCVGPDCTITNQFCCENDLGGTFQGYGTDCDPNPCTSCDTGACCAFGSCFEVSELTCVNVFGGTYLGDCTTCTPDPC